MTPILMGRIIPDFPYKEQYCRFCERGLTLQAAAHIQDREHEYKAIWYCLNPECPSIDAQKGQCYAKVYYSSDEAELLLHGFRVFLKRNPHEP